MTVLCSREGYPPIDEGFLDFLSISAFKEQMILILLGLFTEDVGSVSSGVKPGQSLLGRQSVMDEGS